MTLCHRVSPCRCRCRICFLIFDFRVLPLMRSGCAWLEISVALAHYKARGKCFVSEHKWVFTLTWTRFDCLADAQMWCGDLSLSHLNIECDVQLCPQLSARSVCLIRDRRQRGPRGNLALNASINVQLLGRRRYSSPSWRCCQLEIKEAI